jgi:hypothetical protein
MRLTTHFIKLISRVVINLSPAPHLFNLEGNEMEYKFKLYYFYSNFCIDL